MFESHYFDALHNCNVVLIISWGTLPLLIIEHGRVEIKNYWNSKYLYNLTTNKNIFGIRSSMSIWHDQKYLEALSVIEPMTLRFHVLVLYRWSIKARSKFKLHRCALFPRLLRVWLSYWAVCLRLMHLLFVLLEESSQ